MNIAITSTDFTVTVAFNDYSEDIGIKCESFRRDEMSEVKEHHNGTYITVHMLDGEEFDVSFDAFPNVMVIDTINGISPNSNDDLFDKLVALQQV